MRFFTGDESGLLKWIAFPPKVDDKCIKRVKREESEQDNDKEKKEDSLQPLTGNFGKVNKDLAVQKMIWATLDDEKVIVVARKNGVIQFLSPENGTVKKELRDKHVGLEKEQGQFIGLFIHNNHLCACTSTGHLSYTPLDKDGIHETQNIDELGPDLEVMRAHPVKTNIFGIGGKERELTLFDLDVIIEQKQKAAETTTPDNDLDSAGPHQNTSIHKKKKAKAAGMIFQAKNVPNDMLDLRQPVWIHDFQFVNEDATKIAIVTHYHQFRVYDIKKARRPVINVDIGKNPLRSLAIGTDFNHVVYSDTASTVGVIDVRSGKSAALLKGFTGSVTQLMVAPQPTFDTIETSDKKERCIVSVSLDRFLRVHETSTIYRRMTEKAYLKQRLTCLLVDEEYEYPAPKVKTAEEEEMEEEEAMWKSMEVVEDRKRKHRG